MDGAGLQLLLWAERTARARGLPFQLVAHGQVVDEMLQLLHLGSRFGLESVGQAEGGAA
jgi:anti-anti-sigma regulatory factor